MGWVFTTYEQTDDGLVATEHHMPNITSGKHGTHVVEFHNPLGYDYDVTVYDNSEHGLDADEVQAVAEQAANENVYWSDHLLCHWMFDFKVRGHWCEGLFHNNGLPDEVPSIWSHLHVNVYD